MAIIGWNGLAAALLLAAGAATAQDRGSCVECHQGLPANSAADHDYAEWDRSVHAGAGVNCESCHGGNSSVKDKAAAHIGVLGATDATRRIFLQKIPQTCGTCHEAEYKAFQQSKHFKEFQSSGRGPSCVTCHGSLANVVLGPKEMKTTCTLCHQLPTYAVTARRDLEASAAMVRGLGGALKRASDSGVADLAAQQAAFREIVDMQRTTAIQWHTFKIEDVITDARAVKVRVTGVLAELKLKGLAPAVKAK